MTDLDRGFVANQPSPIDQPPCEFEFLVAIEQIVPVTTGLEIGLLAERRGAAQERGNGASDVGTSSPRSRDMTCLHPPIVVDNAKRHRRHSRIGKRLLDALSTVQEYCIVVEEPHDRTSRVLDADVAAVGNADVLGELDDAGARHSERSATVADAVDLSVRCSGTKRLDRGNQFMTPVSLGQHDPRDGAIAPDDSITRHRRQRTSRSSVTTIPPRWLGAPI
ncbi:MAG: hypothetical protein AAGG08_21370 [Actinomycetota bacterium]